VGRPSTIRERLVLRSDCSDRRTILEESGSAPRLAATFFAESCRCIGMVIGLGSCVCPWLVELA
jgi:hypothetical protein